MFVLVLETIDREVTVDHQSFELSYDDKISSDEGCCFGSNGCISIDCTSIHFVSQPTMRAFFIVHPSLKLFNSFRLLLINSVDVGDNTLSHRVVMAPLTR
jgi:hypothetical protein